MNKVCIVCGQELPISQFPTNRGMPDGHLGWCFECFKFRTWETILKERKRETPAEPPKSKVTKAISLRNRSEEAKEQSRSYALRYYYEHREERLAYQNRYAKSERGKQLRREFEKRYTKTEKYKSWLREYRHRKREEKNKQQLIPTV